MPPRRRPALALAALALCAGPLRADDESGRALVDARRLVRRDRAPAAERLLEDALARAPDDRALGLAYADVERRRCRLRRAEAVCRRLVARDPTDVEALAELADVLVLDGRPFEGLSTADDALLLAPRGREPARAYRAKALALVELRRYDLAMAAAERGVARAPSDPRCLEALGAAAYRAGRMDVAGDAYLRATALEPSAEEANLRLGNGFGVRFADEPWRGAGADAADFQAAVAAWDRDDLVDAGARFLALVARRPDAYKYRLGLGLVRLSLRRLDEAGLGGAGPALYARLPAPELDGLARVVRGYDALTPRDRHVVRVATAPARRLLPAMLAAGATHDVIPLVDDVVDDVSRRDLIGKRTFDGRWYEQLRAVAGPHGATGVEKLREAAELGFHTFAHEFGHQVHRMGLTREQQAQVDVLYASAVGTGACLDWYAASNVEEYFAQGYEAFLSPVKRGCLLETARHTRAELARRDPALHGFLVAVLDLSHESSAAIAALAAAAADDGLDGAAEPPAR